MDRRLWWAAVHRVSKSQTQFSSVTQSCPTLCDPMDCRTPGLPVYQQLPEFTQAHVHWVGDAIQPSHPLSSPSFLAFSLFEHQVFPVSQFFASVLEYLAKVLECPLQHQSFQWTLTQDWSPLGWTGWISLQFKGLSKVFSNTTVQKRLFFSAQLSLWANSHTQLSTTESQALSSLPSEEEYSLPRVLKSTPLFLTPIKGLPWPQPSLCQVQSVQLCFWGVHLR